MPALKFSFTITLEVEDTSESVDNEGIYRGYYPRFTDAREYVRDALMSHGGQRHPSDPFFSPTRVTIKPVVCMPNRARHTSPTSS